MTHRIFDEGNARHGVAASFLNERGDFDRPSVVLCEEATSSHETRTDEAAESRQLEAWQRGECCGTCDGSGECQSFRVRLNRRWKFAAAGYDWKAACANGARCEHAEEYWDSVGCPDSVATDEAKAIVWRAWAERFISEYGAERHGDNIGNEDDGHADTSQDAGDCNRVNRGERARQDPGNP